MPKRYKISEVARLLGVTPETIRYYEKLHLISPVRDDKTGYRYYGTWDIHMLNRARIYHQFGFSLEKSSALMAMKTDLEVADHLEEREKELENEILRSINLLQRMRESKKSIRDAIQSEGTYRLEMRPAMYRLHTQNRYKIDDRRPVVELMYLWELNAAFMDSSALFRLEDVYKGNPDFSFGLVASEAYAEYLGIQASQYVEYFPSVLCLYTSMSSRDTVNQTGERYQPVLQEMKRRGLKPGGDILTRVVVMRRPDDEYFNFHQVWVPVQM
ncbi:MAG: MerR family transcriptional regulator [Clostridiales bacterium]|nr:MerR family transcriptional regulator [Clostridiales bacterium]